MRDYDQSKEPSYLDYWDANNLYGWAMFQKLPTFNFEWVEDISQFDEVFIKNYYKKVKQVIFFRLMLCIQKKCMNSIKTYRFYLREKK